MHGLLVLGSISRVRAFHSLRTTATGGVIYGFNRIRFPTATPVGAQLRYHLVLQAVEAVGDAAVQLTMGITVEIEGETRPACVAEILARYFL